MHAKIDPFKYIKVCKELFFFFLVYLFWLASPVCDKILTFYKPALNFEINKVDVHMYLCHIVTWFGELHACREQRHARKKWIRKAESTFDIIKL